jgi:Cu(I)/Ag(I) efflux system membrane fusion protein
MEREKSIRTSAASIAAAADIAAARVAFEPLSESMYAITVSFGAGLDDTVYQIHCPMAFNNKGADWLQTKIAVENPYFGAKMFKCGKVTDTLRPGTTGK